MPVNETNWDMHLGEVYRQFVAIKDEDYKKSQSVFKDVFQQVKRKMEQQCPYFKKYSRQVLYAGSVYDGIKVSKLDEFDMDVVIRLPINYDKGISIENDQPGFVKLKIGQAFDLLDKQKDWEGCHKVTRDWRDTDKYLLQNKFRAWMHGIVDKTLNELNRKVTANGVTYLVKYKESGPAYTLNIENDKGNEEFTLDVDLVPVIKFQYPRWPKGYRTVKNSLVQDWLVVPKPNKAILDDKVKNRCWRLSFQDFERDMMKGCYQLKPTIRLVKKLRDSLEMKEIASYYIKTIFLWKIAETKEKLYWQAGLGVTFHIMVQEFYNAVKIKKIRYFWQEQNNLIEHLKSEVLELYADKLKKVIDAINNNDVSKIVYYLLNTDELQEYKKSEFYRKQLSSSSNPSLLQVRHQKPTDGTSTSQHYSMSKKLNIESGGKVSVREQNLQRFKNKVGEYIQILTDKHDPKNATCEVNTSNLETKTDEPTDDLKNDITDILKSLHEYIDKLVNKKGDHDEMIILMNKIDMLTDKTNEHGEILRQLKISDTEYKQKYFELCDTVTEVIQVEEPERRDETKGTFKKFLYTAIKLMMTIRAPTAPTGIIPKPEDPTKTKTILNPPEAYYIKAVSYNELWGINEPPPAVSSSRQVEGPIVWESPLLPNVPAEFQWETSLLPVPLSEDTVPGLVNQVSSGLHWMSTGCWPPHDTWSDSEGVSSAVNVTGSNPETLANDTRNDDDFKSLSHNSSRNSFQSLSD